MRCCFPITDRVRHAGACRRRSREALETIAPAGGAGPSRQRYRVLGFRGLTACTPNQSEVEQALGISIDDDAGALERAGRTLLDRTAMNVVLVTRGSRGMALFQTPAGTIHVPVFGSDEIADVTGAGDTVIAAFDWPSRLARRSTKAARLANYAGGLVAMKRARRRCRRGS